MHQVHKPLPPSLQSSPASIPSTSFRPCRLQQQQQHRYQQQRQLQQKWQQHSASLQQSRRQLLWPPPRAEGKEDNSKADFSALWSMRFRQFFTGRRKYLQEANKKTAEEETPQFVRDLGKRIEQQEAELRNQEKDIIYARTALKYGEEVAEEVKRSEEAALKAQAANGGRGQVVSVLDEEALESDEGRMIVSDIQRARQDLHQSPASLAGIAALNTRQFVVDVLLFPVRLARSLYDAWQITFASQSYENFLMAEGERIWYWRNRMENERWFWEIYFWDKLLWPCILVATYEYLVPSNLVWAVVLPLTYFYHQKGELPGWTSIEFWLIAYFGFYQKCWPDVVGFLGTVLMGW